MKKYLLSGSEFTEEVCWLLSWVFRFLHKIYIKEEYIYIYIYIYIYAGQAFQECYLLLSHMKKELTLKGIKPVPNTV